MLLPTEPWELVTPDEPLLSLPRGAGSLDKLAHVLEGVTVLSDVEALREGRYEGVDRDYAARLLRDIPAELRGAPNPWLTQHPPAMSVELTEDGTIRHLGMLVQTPGDGDPVKVDLQFQDYGAQTEIEPPQQ